MNLVTTRRLGAIVIAVLALAGCNRHSPDQTTSSNGSSSDTTVAGGSQGGTSPGNAGGSSATGAPGMSGSPPTATPPGATSTDPNALPPTAAGGASAAAGSAALNASDTKFVKEAAGGGMFEVQVSKLAADKATDPAVKQFAQMLVTDHTNANDELKAFAAAHNVSLPTELPKPLQSEIDKLQKASGDAFDKQYVQTVGLKDHKDDIAKFEKASQETKNPQLKAWVDKTLPTLKEHLAAAQKLPEAGAKTASR
jgi:putative membrane protein